MKLQNLIIVFVIIIIPIVFLFSYYLGLQIDTINMQTDYDHKLIEATKEAMEAFEINTIEWNSEYSTLANSKRRDITASINVFTSGLANKLGMGGTAKEYMLDYVPAMVYVMYDGYYIYTPTYVPKPKTDSDNLQLFYYKDISDDNYKVVRDATQVVNGVITAGEIMYEPEAGVSTKTVKGIEFTTEIRDAKKTYKHILKTFVPYTATYGNYIINYTLDNYIRIMGNNVTKEGYIMPVVDSLIVTPKQMSITYKGRNISPEVLEENIAVQDNSNNIQVAKYKYIYSSSNEKRYYDDATGRFFVVNNSYKKLFLPEVESNQRIAEYKKVLIVENSSATEYLELYQLLNMDDGKLYTKDENGFYYEYTGDFNETIEYTKDYSAINYYVEMFCFNNWLNNTFGISNKEKILENKKQYIIENINNNLQLSISNYSANSSIDYKLPVITDADWEQALSNISIITFFQGAKIGLKIYNNYAVVTSSENNEYIQENALYYYDDTLTDTFYHTFACDDGKNTVNNAYLNIDFKPQEYKDGDHTYVYYKHWGTSDTMSECFDCIVNMNKKNIATDTSKYELLKYTALARERFIKNSRTKLFSN